MGIRQLQLIPPVPLPSDSLSCFLRSMMQIRRRFRSILGQQPAQTKQEKYLGCWQAAGVNGERRSVRWLTGLTRGWAEVKQAFCFVFLSSSTSLQAECWCTSFLSQAGATERSPPLPLVRRSKYIVGTLQETLKRMPVIFQLCKNIRMHLGAWGSGRSNKFALEKGKSRISLVWKAPFFLAWQQAPRWLRLASGLPLKYLLSCTRSDTVFPLYYLLRDLKYPSRFPPRGWICWYH